MGQWIKDLAAGRRTFADRLADRQSQTIPSEDPTTAILARRSPAGPGSDADSTRGRGQGEDGRTDPQPEAARRCARRPDHAAWHAGSWTTTPKLRPRIGRRPGESPAYSVDEAARLTGLSRDLLYDQMRRGNLRYVKIGRRRLITRQHLEQFLGVAS